MTNTPRTLRMYDSILGAFLLLLVLTSCGVTSGIDYSKDIKAIDVVADTTLDPVDIFDLTLSLLKDKTVCSPIATLTTIAALSDNHELNSHVYQATRRASPRTSIWKKLSSASAPDTEYLQTALSYLNTTVHSIVFDTSGMKDVNNWAGTDVLNDINPEYTTYLLSVLNMDMQIDSHSSGEAIVVQGADYIDTWKAEGFIYTQDDTGISFVALLPDKDISPKAYVESLNGKALNTLLQNTKYLQYSATLPTMEIVIHETIDDLLRKVEGLDLPSCSDQYVEFTLSGRKTKTPTLTTNRELIFDRPFIFFVLDTATQTPLLAGIYNFSE